MSSASIMEDEDDPDIAINTIEEGQTKPLNSLTKQGNQNNSEITSAAMSSQQQSLDYSQTNMFNSQTLIDEDEIHSSIEG